MRVLVVEDTFELAALVQLSLERQGWQVDLAEDGATAMAMASPDHTVILVDLGLPDMDGESLVRSLRTLSPDLATLPVIWFTAHHEVVPEGGVGVITKPFDPTTLAGDIARLLS